MKNKYLSYINTSSTPQAVSISYVLEGRRDQVNIILAPGKVLNENLLNLELNKTSTKVVIGTRAQLIDIGVVESDGKIKSILPERFDSPESILKHSKILDIETGGLRPGSPITQIAVTDLSTRRSQLFIPQPNLVATPSSIEQSMSFLNRIKAERIDLPKGTTFSDTVFLEKYLQKEGVQLTDLASRYTIGGRPTLESALRASKIERGLLEDLMLRTDFFQAKHFVDEDKVVDYALSTGRMRQEDVVEFRRKRSFINKVLSGQVTESEVMDFMRLNQGIMNVDDEIKGLDLIKGRTLRDIVASDLPDSLKGGVTWIANTGFESGQFGAQVKAEASRSRAAFNAARAAQGLEPLPEDQFMRGFSSGSVEQQLKEINKTLPEAERVSTRNPFLGTTQIDYRTGKPFDIFGDGEYARVRSQAMLSGDFSEVYDAMLRDTRAGDVRDIQDLSRSMQSKLAKIGILDIQRPTALSVEIQARLALGAREMRLMEEAGEAFDLDRVLKALASKETHFALGDTVLSESPLLEESFDLLESLRKYEQGGAEADRLLSAAKKGEGGLFRAFFVGAVQDALNKGGVSGEGLDDVLFKQMAGRAFEDLTDKGSTEFRTPAPTMGVKRAVAEVKEGLTQTSLNTSPRYRYESTSNMFRILDELERTTQYQHTNKKEFLTQLRSQVAGFFDADGNLIKGKESELKVVAKQYTESAGDQIRVITSRLKDFDQTFMQALRGYAGFVETKPKMQITEGVYGYGTRYSGIKSIIPQGRVIGGSLREQIEALKPQQKPTVEAFRPPVSTSSPSAVDTPPSATKNLLDKMKVPEPEIAFKSVVKRGVIGAALIGVGFGLIDRLAPTKKDTNYLLPDFETFLEAQSKFYGSKQNYQQYLNEKYRIDGLQEEGLLASMRSMFTDFGSPYQGMGYSMSVLDDINLRRERHKYVQMQFGNRHFSIEGDVGLQLKRFVDSAFKKEIGTNISSPIFFGNYKKIDNTKYHGLKGDDLVEYKFNPADIDISDADTITVKRRGAPNNSLSAFMGTGMQESMSFRLAGIDAPETAHGDRSAQPYAEAAKQIATDLIRNAKEVKIVSRPDDKTYGRQVGMVYIDGKNLNLELVKRGAAAYLPYKSKGKPQFYNQKAFEDAQKFAQKSKRGMWRTAYFQAYQLMTQESGQTVTFNTLVNPAKVAQNSSLMSMYSLMNQADKMGFINTALQQELSMEGQKQKFASQKSGQNIFAPDEKFNSWMSPELSLYGQNQNSITTVLDQLKTETRGLYKTKGSKVTSEVSKVGRVSGRNLQLSQDSIKAAKINWNSEKETRLSDIQKSTMRKQARLKAMEEMQQIALGNQFNSPIGHHRM